MRAIRRIGLALAALLLVATSAAAQVTPVYQGIRFGSFDSGAAGTPSITFTFDRTTGIWLVGVRDLGVSVGGTKVADWTSTLLTLKTAYNLKIGSNQLTTSDLLDASKLTGTVPAVNGGTGMTYYAQGDLLYANATNVLARLKKNTGLMMTLCNSGPWNAPAWCRVASSNLSDGTNIGLLNAANIFSGNNTFSGANTYSGVSTFTGRPDFKQYTETKSAPAISSNTLTINLQNGTFFAVSMNANVTTLTLSNPPASGTAGSVVLVLTQDGTGGRTVTWPAAVKWPSAAAPSLSAANKTDIVTLVTFDGGTTYYGFISGQNY